MFLYSFRYDTIYFPMKYSMFDADSLNSLSHLWCGLKKFSSAILLCKDISLYNLFGNWFGDSFKE